MEHHVSQQRNSEKSDRKPLVHIPHLDGVRAVALVGVLGFHFKLESCRGGYLGVDMFLILSGFLMTRNIQASLFRNDFKIFSFYQSRFWRLYPSSFVVVAVCMVVAFTLSSPEDAVELCKSSLAALYLVSNFYFYSSSSYFDVKATRRPLLHYWSLSMEENFYLIWPCFLMILNRRKVCLSKRAILAFIFISGAGSHYSCRFFPTFAFYLLPGRVWQFALGALVAQYESELTALPNVVSSLLLYLGLLGTTVCFTLAPVNGGFRWMLLSSLSAILLVSSFSSEHTSILLANPWMRYVGRLSYSAYLVHWPIVVYRSRWASAFQAKFFEVALLSFLTLAAATMLHLNVESKFRSKSRQGSSSTIMFAALIALTAVSLHGVWTSGWRYRFHVGTVDSSQGRCVPLINDHGTQRQGVGYEPGCIIGQERDNFTISNGVKAVVVGNSFANQLRGAFNTIHEKGDRPVIISSMAGCSTMPLKVVRAYSSGSNECLLSNKARWSWIEKAPNGSFVIFAENWAVKQDTPDRRWKLSHRINYLINETLSLGKWPVILGAPPGFAEYIYFCYDLRKNRMPFLKYISNNIMTCQEHSHPLEKRTTAESVLSSISGRGSRFSYLSLYSTICNRTQQMCRCATNMFGVLEPIYMRDCAHMTLHGSSFFGREHVRQAILDAQMDSNISNH